ncbi:MAG: acetate--CoA ligase family protein, partial [Myxococcales bacterium]|nr:acetate--CoA ligase family protein [Myxococcales bacterium]
AGFAEIGGEGVERQDELLAAVRRAGMRMVGPNCLGLLHTHADVRLNASFAPNMPPRGAVGLCSQSGALGVAIIALARRIDLGMSSFVSVGNKADISAIDLLEWWEQDETTDVLLFYLEAFGDPRHFAPVARRVGRRKPIVMVKAGRTEAGGRAASSHTAALAASETAVEALFRQTGILRAETLEEMFGLARALTQQPLPRGRRVAVVTNAGGPGILCVDALEGAGLEVPRLAPGTRATLNAFLPSAASSANPVDMIASAGPREFRAAVEVLLRAEEVDALVVLYTPAGMFVTESVAESVVAGVTAAREAGIDDKPVFVSVVGDEEETYAIRDDHETLPAYRFPEEIGRVLGKMVEYAEWRRADPGVFVTFGDQSLAEARAIVTGALDERGEGWLSLAEARRTLEAAGLTVAPGGVATSAKEAAAIAKEVGFPVAVKLASLQLVHKTEIGGVVLGLQDAEAVEAAYRGIEERLAGMGRADAMDGALVQPMLEGAAEVMIGVNQDPVFGPLIAFGLGGIHVEVLRDVAFRVAPLSDRDASAMVSEIRGHQLLQGYRGHAAADIAALEEALLRMSRLVEAVPEIREIDLNPIFALEPGHGYRIVDARIRVA